MVLNEENNQFKNKTRVTKVCDRCGGKREVYWQDVRKCRRKKSHDGKDYCYKCSMFIFNSGDGNPSKRIENRLKISAATKGKSKKFKDGRNLRILPVKMESNGYVMEWNDKYGKHIPQHRLVMERLISRTLFKGEQVHHIDGDKRNNNDENLLLCKDNREHSLIHSQLDGVLNQLIKNNILFFSREDKEYKISSSFLANIIPQSLSFNDIAILQKNRIVNSRSEVDTSSEIIRGVKIQVPIIAANMFGVTNSDLCINLSKLGGMGVLHRAMKESDILLSIKECSKEIEWVAASIGVNGFYLKMLNKMIKNGCNIIFIDIAHCYSDNVFDFVKKIKMEYPFLKIVLGNTTNIEVLYKTYDFIDALKVGIGQGSVCETKDTAGCTEKQFTAILKFKDISKSFGIPIISDGSIKIPSDFSKAIAAGASSIMAGRIFAKCPESPAEVRIIDNKQYKVYAGMSSRYVQEKWRNKVNNGCPEGKTELLEIGEGMAELLKRYAGALRSAISYGGADSIQTFQKTVEFIRI
jgi:IMP dehydrogenase